MPARTPSPSPQPLLSICNSARRVCYPLGVPSQRADTSGHGSPSSTSGGLDSQVAHQAPPQTLPRLSPREPDSSSSPLQTSGIGAHHQCAAKRRPWRMGRVAKFRRTGAPLFAWRRLFRLFGRDASSHHRLFCHARLPCFRSELSPGPRKSLSRRRGGCRCGLSRALSGERSQQGIVVAGDSAGGALALSLMLALRAAGSPLPAAAALFSPWTDLAATGESVRTNARRCAIFHGPAIAPTARLYLADADPRNPLASPLYADLSGLPPLLIHVGANETLRDDSTRLAEKARAAAVGVELKIWPVVPHVWQLAPDKIPEARQSLRESAEFLRRHAAVVNSGALESGQHA